MNKFLLPLTPVMLMLVSVAFARIDVQGHRGARAVLPENSVPAFDYALKVGVDTLELDLGVSKDKVLVVTHDPYINPELCLDSNGQKLKEKIPLNSLTAKQIQEFDCGSIKNPKFPKQKTIPQTPIPTFKEVLELVRNSKHESAKTVKLNVETKIFLKEAELTPSPSEFAKLVVDELVKHKLLERSNIQSFDHRTLNATKKISRKIKTAYLSEGGYPDYVALARSLKFDILSPEHIWVDQDSVQAMHRLKIQVIPWTANEVSQWERLVAIGADGIITDDPEALIEFLKSKGLR